jgi:glucosamine--fructose-6-phosphate aminotransferase (isomerizing)
MLAIYDLPQLVESLQFTDVTSVHIDHTDQGIQTMRRTIIMTVAGGLRKIHNLVQCCYQRMQPYLIANVYLGKSPSRVPRGSIVFFPLQLCTFYCGIAGIVTFINREPQNDQVDVAAIEKIIQDIESFGFDSCQVDDPAVVDEQYLGGKKSIDSLWRSVQVMKNGDPFYFIFSNPKIQDHLERLSKRLVRIINSEATRLADDMGHLDTAKVDVMSSRIESLKDITWCLDSEIAANIKKTKKLIDTAIVSPNPQTVKLFKKINAVLNSIDRLEVRGRDSAGISLMVVLDGQAYERFEKSLAKAHFLDRLRLRCDQQTLVNRGISIHKSLDQKGREHVAISVTYKIAVEVGRLGDNIRYLRQEIADDAIVQILATFAAKFDTVSAHTRWASVGAITEPNCHPVDNSSLDNAKEKIGIILACLNGDIDNYQELKQELEHTGVMIPKDITTDTKIIPMQIQKYVLKGHGIEDAFRLAVNDFEGSHAISMHTDLAPGKIFLAQKGSGQAIFVGLAEEHYMPTSEVYGFAEVTPYYLKLDGETVVEGQNGQTQGQIFILTQETTGGLDGIHAMYYDGTPVQLSDSDIKYTEITSRDIDRQDFPHYFLKEISESPDSVEKTLQNRWKIKDGGSGQHVIILDQTVIPESLQNALISDQIKRIFFIGQGTAGVAALACANILHYYLDKPSMLISALKASEFSGFQLNEHDAPTAMADTLVIAISQSGTTTDTNRTVDMVKERGAYTLAIVNRRDSDLTFKVDGVMYTSSGRDIEMSVASTKAFYSQIVAGAILGLYIARLKKRRSDEFVSIEIKRLLELPAQMRRVLALGDSIATSAKKLAVTKTYWAAVGSGPNKASADEIRIKLSELCYKTISSDFVEDKKHIDLSSEPLIIVCAAGTRGTVINDIIKDTAIFKAHKATPIVIADEGERRFDPYADTVFHVPVVNEHLAPILNTLAGHIWGYYAALAINDGSRLLYGFQDDIQTTIDDYAGQGLDVYEILLEKPFREKIAQFYREFRQQRAEKRFPSAIGFDAASDLTLLLKYLSGRLPISDFEIDFSQKGTPTNMIYALFKCLGESINFLARPVDAIKHQAKTVTVGTSRISDRIEGILFEALSLENFNISQLTTSNIIVMKNLQGIIARVEGSILYQINRLNLLGEPVDETTIEVKGKRGIAGQIPSRVEGDTNLKGSKRIIVSQGNVYIGKGRKDDRSILVIPILSASPSTPNFIEYLLLLHISFKKDVPLPTKMKALGGKYEHIKNIVQENSIAWEDRLLELPEIQELFGISAEKIGELIISRINNQK